MVEYRDPQRIEVERPASDMSRADRRMDDGRPPRRGPETGGLFDNRPNIVNAVYLVGLFTALPLFVGGILAYIWKGDPETHEWERSHMRYHVRTFWLSIAYHVLALFMILSLILMPLGVLLWGGAFLFTVMRCIKSFSLAQAARPIPNEDTWLW